MKKVYIGVGHGGEDPGAVAQGFREKDLALSIATACADELIVHGLEVKLSRTSDVTERLDAKIQEANAYHPDLALDIHLNAGGGDGCEVYHSYLGGVGKTLAENIVDQIVALGQNTHGKSGVKTRRNENGRDYFGFIRQINAPAVLVEVAFIDTGDIKFVDTPDEQKAAGKAIARGILHTLGIAVKVESKPSAGTVATCIVTMPVLKKGDIGGAVKPLQALLVANGLSVGAAGVDGIFGADTELAVRKWQQRCGLNATGIMDTVTWKTLLGVAA